MAGRLEISLDPLPLKRVLAMEENGTEHLPPELSQEEKSLALLARIDFGHEAKKVKTEDGSKEKEEETVQVWPWQGLVDHLQQAHQELAIILDLINHVEANEAVTVARMERPKMLPQETCSDLALRASSKLHHFRNWYGQWEVRATSVCKTCSMNVGKYLKRSAQALERQVEREAVFYGALMRLQRNWKVKRQRGVAAGPGGSAGFSIDVGTSETAPCVVTIDQDPAGLLVAHPPAAHSLASLYVTLHSRPPPFKSGKEADHFTGPVSTGNGERPEGPGLREAPKPADRNVGEGVDRGATSAQAVLRRIQAANFDEQVFEWVGREALLLSPSISMTGLSDTSLQLSLGYATTLTLHLTPVASPAEKSQGPVKDEWNTPAVKRQQHDQTRWPSNEASLGICLQQAYQQFMNGRRNSASSKETVKAKDDHSEAAGIIKHLSAIMRHHVACEKIVSVLEKQVHGVPQLRLASHPTWHARVSAWDLWLDIPDTTSVGRWQASIVLREDVLTIAGLPAGDGGKPAPIVCTLSELSPFLLYQVAGHLVAWLHAEATGMGVAVQRDLLSITFELESFEDVALAACPDIKLHTVNWVLRLSSSSGRGEDFDNAQRFLGPLPSETLKAIVIDLVNEKLDSKLGGDSSGRGDTFSEHERFARHASS